MKWRIIKNEWNLKGAPWSGAIGIEENDDSTAVPAVVCWFTRGWERPLAMAQSVVDEHNRNVVSEAMINAGSDVLRAEMGGVDAFWSPEDLAASVYRAMRDVDKVKSRAASG